jgi:hypothetical protein
MSYSFIICQQSGGDRDENSRSYRRSSTHDYGPHGRYESLDGTGRARIENGAKVKAEDYVQARRDIDLLRREINKTFASFDLLITPTMPSPRCRLLKGRTPQLCVIETQCLLTFWACQRFPFRAASHRPACPSASRSLGRRSLSQPFSPSHRLTNARRNGTKNVRS